MRGFLPRDTSTRLLTLRWRSSSVAWWTYMTRGSYWFHSTDAAGAAASWFELQQQLHHVETNERNNAAPAVTVLTDRSDTASAAAAAETKIIITDKNTHCSNKQLYVHEIRVWKYTEISLLSLTNLSYLLYRICSNILQPHDLTYVSVIS